MPFDQLVETFLAYPYLGVALVFLICGLGLPLPEEIVLIAAGYVCYRGAAEVEPMILACAIAILAGDILPFALGRWLGLPLLRLRPMRMIITPQRLARFNRWFRRRGSLVIFFARFIAGIRVVAYFTAGTMKTSWIKFISLDLLGIALIVPTFVLIGKSFGSTIDDAIDSVQRAERGLLFTILGVGLGVGLWFWLRWRKKQRALVGTPTETYVEPSGPVRGAAAVEAAAGDEDEHDQDAPVAPILSMKDRDAEGPPPESSQPNPDVDAPDAAPTRPRVVDDSAAKAPRRDDSESGS